MSDELRGPKGRWPEAGETEQVDPAMPEHEIDTDTAIGAGVVAVGGTATDRTGGEPSQPAPHEDEPGAGGGPPAHLDEDDQPVLDEPNRWVFGGRSG